MLTVAKDDPNYEKEVKRMKDDPKSFGQDASLQLLPKDFDYQSSGLVADLDKKESTGIDPELFAQWVEYLDKPVAALVSALDEIEYDSLVIMKQVEVQNKNRASLIKAIDEKLNQSQGE